MFRYSMFMKKVVIVCLLAAALSVAQRQRVVVLPAIADPETKFSARELDVLTDKLRGYATDVLPLDDFALLKQDYVKEKLGDEALFKACKEGTCVGDLIAKGEDEARTISTFSEEAKDLKAMMAAIEKRVPDAFRRILPEIAPAALPPAQYAGLLPNAVRHDKAEPQLWNAGNKRRGAGWHLAVGDQRIGEHVPLGSIRLLPGAYNAKLFHGDYEDIDFSVEVAKGEHKAFDISDKIVSRFGILDIKPAYADGIGESEDWHLKAIDAGLKHNERVEYAYMDGTAGSHVLGAALDVAGAVFFALSYNSFDERDKAYKAYADNKGTGPNAHDGEAAGGVPPADMAGHYGDVILLPNQGGLMRYGYGLRKWKADSLGKLISYEAGGRYTVTGNIAMSAVWVPVYAVSFDGNGATGGTAPAAMSTGSGLVVTLPGRGDLKKTEHIFAGWNTDSSGTGTRYEAGSSHTVAGDITLYAIWVYCPGYNPGTHICDERDLQAYRITAIGTQTWLAENLNYNATGSKCCSNLDSNCDKYGRLYNWATAMNNAPSSTAVPSGVRGVCPEGWHLPSRAEWEVMTAYIGGSSTEGRKLKATSGWNSSGNGTDEYGFSALPGGDGSSDGSFGIVGYYGYWWSASEHGSGNAYSRRMSFSDEYANWYNVGKSYLFSVRCLQD